MTVNKVIAAVLVALLLVKVTALLAEVPFHVEAPAQPAYGVALPEEASVEEELSDADQGPTLAMLLAEASVDKGERSFRKCSACHTIEAGGDHRIGPNLHNIIGATVGEKPGFSYSDALAQYDGVWSYELMDAWLENPKDAFPGNKMAFAGLRKAEERADVIAFMRSHTESPPPLPEAPAAEPLEGAPASR